MKTLSYKTLEENGYDGYLLKDAPERVLQFGEGNFLRAFVDYFIDLMNEKAGFNSKVVLVQPIAAPMIHDMINNQDGLYTLYLRGQENGQAVNKKRVISCVSRCIDPYAEFDALMACADNPDLRFITCNTTEAGIAYDPNCKFEDKPAASYPGKLCQFMYRRFQKFGDQKGKGFIILSCELIDNNFNEMVLVAVELEIVFHFGDFAINAGSHVATATNILEKFLVVTFSSIYKRCENINRFSAKLFGYDVNYLVVAVFHHFLASDIGICR